MDGESPVAIGEVVASKYRVDAVLGQGGMGVVVAATHTELDQKVALKFLLPSGAADPNVASRFLREARASARLKSPHVARTLDTGRLEDGRPFIVMEFLEGRDLAAELEGRAEPLPVIDAASYVLQACDALAEAHAAGIVHRDLKPANLFLARGHDGRPTVKVLDFGISKILDGGEGATLSSLTSTGAVLGSPAYMSPEQMRASRGVDARTDIWALGVALYELLTNHVPFPAKSHVEMVVMVTQDAPTPPTAYRADLPPEIERIVLKCLAKDPADRFASVAELANELARFASPRDRVIAERIADIATASSRVTAPPPSPSSPALERIAVDTTQLAVSAAFEVAPSRRARPIAVVAVGLVACAIALVGWRAISRPSATITSEASATTSSEASATTPSMASATTPSEASAAPDPSSPSAAISILPTASVIMTETAPDAGHRAHTAQKPRLGPVASVPRAIPSMEPTAPPPAPIAVPDAGRFFPVRE